MGSIPLHFDDKPFVMVKVYYIDVNANVNLVREYENCHVISSDYVFKIESENVVEYVNREQVFKIVCFK